MNDIIGLGEILREYTQSACSYPLPRSNVMIIPTTPA